MEHFRWMLAVALLVAASVAGASDDMSAEEQAEAIAEGQQEQAEVSRDGLDEETASIIRSMATTDWQELRDAINELAEAGDPEALPVLQALRDGRLFFDDDARLLVEDAIDESLRDPVKGDSVEREGLSLTEPRMTNAVRRSLRPVIAQLQINSDDVQLRLAAAEELADRPQEPMLSQLEEAAEGETHAEIERLLNIAIARLKLDADSESDRLAAVEVVAEVRSSRMKSQLQGLLSKDADGEYEEQSVEVRRAAEGAIEAIEARERIASFFSDLVYGLSMGSILLLAAMGLAIIFGLMRVINMAHGELLMIGAYSAFIVQNLFAVYAPQLFNFYLLAAIPIAFLITALVGIAMERSIIRYLYARPLETLLATWGISLILMQTMRSIFGAQNVRIVSPEWFSGSVQIAQGVSLSTSRVGVILFAFFVVALVWFLMNRTRLGLEVRAVMQNREMAAALGVSANRVDMWTFGAGAGVAGLGGVALSQIVNVGPELGQGYIVDSFMVVVLGGVGNILGSVFSALGLGVFSKFLEPVTGAVLAKILLFAAIIVFIQWRPQGIFALKGRSADD